MPPSRQFFLAIVSAIAAAAGAACAEPKFERQDLFESGKEGYALYRIPGLIVTAKGSLLAYCEARKSPKGDWGATDVMIRRSTDGGRTWLPPQKLPAVDGPIAKNPAAVKQKLVKEGDRLVNSPIAIADRSGPIHFVFSVENNRCFYSRSDDDGQSFSKPREITSAFEAFRPEYAWQVFATGPGHGIQLRNTNRLIIPVWLSTGTGRHAHRPSCVSTIVSDDCGSTWQRGTVVCNDPYPSNPSESAIVQLADGRVMLNIRHESEPHLRAVSVSDNGQTGWSPLKYDKLLPDPICQASMVRLTEPPDDPRTRLLFCNPEVEEGRARKNLTVKLSYDEGESWPEKKVIEPGPSAYSDLAIGQDGSIYCFFERGPYKTLSLAKFNLEWLTDSRDRLR